MQVHQFATSLTYGDAISDEMMEIRKALRAQGFASEIFVRYFDPRMAVHIRDYREYKKYSSPDNVVIFHFSIGSPVSKLFFRIPDRKIMIYHNITPHEFFLDYHRILTRECYKGRLEINLFKGKVDLALGDSEYNREELDRVGYTPTGVLPILMDFSKFDIKGDPIVKEVFGGGAEENGQEEGSVRRSEGRSRTTCSAKTTILYVGRVIPNKKFEDIIRVYYWYKRLFNRHSQLILAGDYRGIERYHAALQDLVLGLALKDVHITGHVEFPELVSYYRLADCYLSMSEHEGFGVPLLEAFYMKVPVVAYAAGAVEETMNGGGVLLREKDFVRAAAIVNRIARDGDLRQRIIDGQTKALEKYKAENISRILLEHVRRVSEP